MTVKLINGYEVVIGFETHPAGDQQQDLQPCQRRAFGAEPNTGQRRGPGPARTLPVMNKKAVECAIKLGLSLGSTIAPRSIFARKNYASPRPAQGYQISQFEIPVVQGGEVSFYLEEGKNNVLKTVRLVRAHLGRCRQVRARRVHRPVRHRPEPRRHAAAGNRDRARYPLHRRSRGLCQELHKIVTWIGICDGNMQEGCRSAATPTSPCASPASRWARAARSRT